MVAFAVFRLCSVAERAGLLLCAAHCSTRHPHGTCHGTPIRALESFQASTLCIGHGIRRHGIRRLALTCVQYMERYPQGSAMPRLLGRAAASPPPPHFLVLAPDLALRAAHVDRIRRSAEALCRRRPFRIGTGFLCLPSRPRMRLFPDTAGPYPKSNETPPARARPTPLSPTFSLSLLPVKTPQSTRR